MDTTTIIAVPLIAGFGGWLGSFLNGYSSEKGKNLATHEDIDKLVNQVRIVTQTTKDIEAKISDQVWDRQRRWELKRDQIFKIADQASTAKDSLIFLASALRTVRDESVDAPASESFQQRVEAFTNDLNEFDRLAITSSLICDKATVVAVTNYSIAVRQLAGELLSKRKVELDLGNRHVHIQVIFSTVLDALRAELQ